VRRCDRLLMTHIASGLSYLDLEYLDTPRVIATAVLQSPSGVALIGPGPSSTIHTLVERLADEGMDASDISAVLLTHIHLDHAGAVGTLVRRNPRIRVYMHERGAPHLVNPEKLLASGTRISWPAALTCAGEGSLATGGPDNSVASTGIRHSFPRIDKHLRRQTVFALVGVRNCRHMH
jgi:glyoxylase-like metal-dependent hydrolase (beta-lactamase superfamily II)